MTHLPAALRDRWVPVQTSLLPSRIVDAAQEALVWARAPALCWCFPCCAAWLAWTLLCWPWTKVLAF